MSHQASVATLQRYSFIAWSVSLLLFVFGVYSLLLFIRPAALGVVPGSISSYQGNITWAVAGAIFVVCGIIFQGIAYRWPRHLLSVLSTQQPKPMSLQVEIEEDTDETRYYACLTDHSENGAPKSWRVGLWAPSQDTRSLAGHEMSAKVYLDPKTAEPAVIEHAKGYLWAMKGAVTPSQE